MGLYSKKNTARLDGKTVIITGSNTGIGKETAQDLYKRGAHVIMACRSVDKAEEAAKEIRNSCKTDTNLGKLAIVELNLCSLKSIADCTNKILAKHERIDILINNAGIFCCPYGKTEDGFEMQFGTNHLGHFLFTLLLLPKIIESKPARIITISSTLHSRGHVDFEDINWEKREYSPMGSYMQSKLCNVLFTRELERRLKEANIEGVNVYSLHPGVIATDIQRHLDDAYCKGLTGFFQNIAKYFIKTPVEGAQTTIYCAIDEAAGKESGLYYSDCKAVRPGARAQNMDDARELWEISREMTNLLDYNPFVKK